MTTKEKTSLPNKAELVELMKTKSFYEISEEYETYPNKLRRMCQKLGIKVPNKSEAQAKAIKTGRTKHPTAGTALSQETKNKIGEGIAKTWEGKPQGEKDAFAKASKKRWDETPKHKKEEFAAKAARAVRVAAKRGSKTEIYLAQELRKAGYAVDFHKQRLIPNEKLEIDILLPSLKTVIEINGITHYEPIHGEEILTKKLKSDQQKYGLLNGTGYCVIVVKHIVKTITDLYHRRLLAKVLEQVEKIDKKFPDKGKRLIRVEV